MKRSRNIALIRERIYAYLIATIYLVAMSGCSKIDDQVLAYAESLPNFCENDPSLLWKIEFDHDGYGKALEKSGWYGKWDTVYSQLCTHYLAWGEYEKSKEFGRIYFFRTPTGHHLGSDYFVAEYLTTETLDFASRFEKTVADREFLSVLTWDQQTIELNQTLRFETLVDPSKNPFAFYEWLSHANVLDTLKILSARILKREESQSTEEAIERLLENFMTQSEFSDRFVDQLSRYSSGGAFNEWLISSILFERYARYKGRFELVERIRNFRIAAAKRNPQAAPPSCISENGGVFSSGRSQLDGKTTTKTSR